MASVGPIINRAVLLALGMVGFYCLVPPCGIAYFFSNGKRKKKKRKQFSVVWLDSKNLPMVGVFTNQSFKTKIAGDTSLKHQQWLKWANNQNVALAHSVK
jgi:hypothetical protein